MCCSCPYSTAPMFRFASGELLAHGPLQSPMLEARSAPVQCHYACMAQENGLLSKEHGAAPVLQLLFACFIMWPLLYQGL